MPKEVAKFIEEVLTKLYYYKKENGLIYNHWWHFNIELNEKDYDKIIGYENGICSGYHLTFIRAKNFKITPLKNKYHIIKIDTIEDLPGPIFPMYLVEHEQYFTQVPFVNNGKLYFALYRMDMKEQKYPEKEIHDMVDSLMLENLYTKMWDSKYSIGIIKLKQNEEEVK